MRWVSRTENLQRDGCFYLFILFYLLYISLSLSLCFLLGTRQEKDLLLLFLLYWNGALLLFHLLLFCLIFVLFCLLSCHRLGSLFSTFHVFLAIGVLFEKREKMCFYFLDFFFYF